MRSACVDDPALGIEITKTIEQHERMDEFLLDPLIPRLEERKPFAPGDLAADRFRIVREVGAGGMAVVYEAIDETLGGRCAIKCPRPGGAPRHARHPRQRLPD